MGIQHIKIADHIPKDRFISRAELVRLTGCSDRHVRKLIEQARRSGYRIVSNTGTGGYKMAESGGEWSEFVERERHRAVATFKKVTGLPEAQLTILDET